MAQKLKSTLLSKFQGCLVGAVLGDCIGSVFECEWSNSVKIDRVLKVLEQIEKAAAAPGKPLEVWTFTDDTAMVRSVANVLIEKKGMDTKEMAKRFSEEYLREPFRGYGGSVSMVFQKLKNTDYVSPFKPAKEQFEGQGSYGNGGAMRIAPAALFTYKDNDSTVLRKLTEDVTKITHAHYQAIQGALLQSYAVDLALRSNGQVNVDKFIDTLHDLMKNLEEETKTLSEQKNSENDENVDIYPYCYKLEKIREFTKRKEATTPDEIVTEIGTGISALEAVSAAVYSFLYSTRDIEGLENKSHFEKTIIYSISLGGDTDTIATMACAIAGAYYGLENIPKSWQKCCEGVEDALTQAQGLYALQTDSSESGTEEHCTRSKILKIETDKGTTKSS